MLKKKATGIATVFCKMSGQIKQSSTTDVASIRETQLGN